MERHALTPQVASASILLLWSQLAGLLAHLEQDASLPEERPVKDAVTSYRESPLCLSQSITSSSEPPPDGAHSAFPLPSTATAKESLHDDAQERRASSLQRQLLSAFQKLEARAAEKTQASLPDDCSALDASSLQEQCDSALVSSFLRSPVVDLLCDFLEGLKESYGLCGSHKSGSVGDDSTRHETLEVSSASTERGGDRLDSDLGSEDGVRFPLLENVDSKRLIAHIFNSSLFNFCLDRMVEARNRYHAKAVLRGDFRAPAPGPPTLGIQGFSPSSGIHTNTSEPLTEIQHPPKALELQDQTRRIQRLTDQKLAREAELKEQARARKNLKVQVSTHMSLFRALADLASFPIEVINDAESDDTDRQITSSTEVNETETDSSTLDKHRIPLERFNRGVFRGRRPRVAVPNVPAEIAAVLKKEKVHGLQVKRAVEAVVALKAEQLDLIVANITLEATVQTLQQERMLKPDPFMGHNRQLSQRPSNIMRPPTIQESSIESEFIHPSRCRNVGLFNQMDPTLPQRGVSPMLRPLQSSPHVNGSEYRASSRPTFMQAPEDLGPPMSPPYVPCQYSLGSAPFATIRRPLQPTRWSPDLMSCHRRSLPDRLSGHRYAPPSAAFPYPYSTFGQGPFMHRSEEGFGSADADAFSDCDGTHLSISPRPDTGVHMCFPHQHSRPNHMPSATPFRHQHTLAVNRSRSFMTYQHPEPSRELCQSLSVMVNEGAELTPSQTLGEEDMHRAIEERTETNQSARGSLATPSRKSNKGGALATSWSNVKKTFFNVTRGAKSKRPLEGEDLERLQAHTVSHEAFPHACYGSDDS